MDTTPTLYHCPSCKESFPAECYYWAKRTRRKTIGFNPDLTSIYEYRRVDSRHAYCIPCTKSRQNKAYHDPMAKELKRAKRIQERLRAMKEGKRLKRALTEESKAKIYAGVKAWRHRNADKYRALDSRYKKMKRSPEFKANWPLIAAHYSNECCGCGDPQAFVDHVIPLDPSKPHTNCLANLQPICRSCNGRKLGMTYDWRPDHGIWILDHIPNATRPFGAKDLQST